MILLTGGAGFIGSLLLAELNKAGREDIIVVDRLRDTSKWKNLNGLKFENYIHADEFFAGHDALYPEIDFIFHLGASSSTTVIDMDYLIYNNVNYSKNLYDLALQNNAPFIYASSAATYGAGENDYRDEHKLIRSLRPLNPYGYSKQLFDEWVVRQTRKPPLWLGLKFFNVFGPNEYHKASMRSLVHKAFEQIHDKGSVGLFKSHKEGIADGMQRRDFVYAVDIVRAMMEMMKVNDANLSGIYNMGTGKSRTFYDLVTATFTALGRAPEINFIDMPPEMRGQYQYFTEANMQKFTKLLPHFKFSALEDAVTDYVQNYLCQANQYYPGAD